MAERASESSLPISSELGGIIRRAFSSNATGQIANLAIILNDASPQVRAVGAGVVGVLGAFGNASGTAAAPELARLLTDPSVYVRTTAAGALGATRQPAYAEQLLPSLKDKEFAVRTAAAAAIGVMGAKQFAPDLAKLLTDPHDDGYVRAAAAIALAMLDPTGYGDKIVPLLAAGQPGITKSAAAIAVGLSGDPRFGKYVRPLLQDGEAAIVTTAIASVWMMNASDQLDAVAATLTNSDDTVKTAAILVLGAIGSEQQAPALAAMLDGGAESTQMLVVRSLGRLGAAKFAPRVAKLLDGADAGLRAASALALGAMRATSTIGALTRRLSDRDAAVRAAAARALGELKAKQAEGSLLFVLKDNDAGVRAAGMTAYAVIADAGKAVPEAAALLGDPNGGVRVSAALTLGRLGAATYANQLVRLLADTQPPEVRAAAATALARLKHREAAPLMLPLLMDPLPSVRLAAKDAVESFGPYSVEVVGPLLEPSYKDPSKVGESRFFAHYLTGGAAETKTLLRWLGSNGERPDLTQASNAELREALQLMLAAWPTSENTPSFRRDMEETIARMASRGSWRPADRPLLKAHADNLANVNSPGAAALREAAREQDAWAAAVNGGRVALVHLAIWLGVLLAYPYSAFVRSRVFYSPWVRKGLGVWYVGVIMVSVPWVRNRLLQPFRESMRGDLGEPNAQAYFDDSDVIESGSKNRQKLSAAIAGIRGHVMLEGDSGLGKSMFLRQLIRREKNNVVFLPAESCAQGVIAGIRQYLPNQPMDDAFLLSVIHEGGLAVVIDGLNGVSPATRAHVSAFVSGAPRPPHVLIATQPIDWKPAIGARTFSLQPLSRDQISAFLLTKKPLAQAGDKTFVQRCEAFLQEAFSSALSTEERASADRVLSNPMDLTFVAQVIAAQEAPNLFRLQKQQYDQMAVEYQSLNIQPFPLEAFSEWLYELRLSDQPSLSAERFPDALARLEAHKMAGSRQSRVGDTVVTTWHFRHDKILDFFLRDAFTRKERTAAHLDDPRFRGVYFMLAAELPLAEAAELREQLIQHASQTKDHHLADSVIGILRLRKQIAA